MFHPSYEEDRLVLCTRWMCNGEVWTILVPLLRYGASCCFLFSTPTGFVLHSQQ